MKLIQSQKNELNRLHSYVSDSFFSYLDTYEYEKKHEKLDNAKEAYAKYSYDEEPLFLLDDTLFGGADDGIVITNKAIYIKIAFEDKEVIYLENISSVKYIKDQTISINSKEINMIYLENVEHMMVNIINKLCGFYKEHTIKEKGLDVYSTIMIPYSLAQSGGKYKDTVSGYDITIPKGVKDGTVWNWDGYGKSYGSIKGKLTVTIKVELPKPKPRPEPKVQQTKVTQSKQEIKNIYVDCVNCGKAHLNPTSHDCVFCGKSLTVVEKKEVKKVVKEEVSLNDIKVDESEFELIVTCANCDKEIKNYSSDICPHCGQDANIKKKEPVKTKSKQKSGFTLILDDKIDVKELQKEFRTNTGLFLRIYDGRSQARANKKVSNLEAKGEVEISTRMKIETIENAFKEVGLKVQIASSDNEKLCDNKLSLAKAKEKYIMEK